MAFEKFVSTDQQFEQLDEKLELIIVELEALLNCQFVSCSKETSTDSGSR